jgi:O-antigen/teichoic acid export membrane protein
MVPMDATPPNQRSWPRRLLNRLEVDRAVFFALLARIWQFLTGPVTLLLIAHHFSPQEQGFYYTFWSVISLQSLFELSFYMVIVNVASHEWQKLYRDERGRIAGDPQSRSRLISLGRFSLLWYSVASLLFVAVIGAGGLLFFASASQSVPNWQHPWLVLVALSGLSFAITPFQGILEGCNQVATVYRLQFWRVLLGNLATWISIPMGAGLWTPVVAAIVRLACDGYLFTVSFGSFFAGFLHQPEGPCMNWRREVWPMQWRVGLKGVFLSFTSQIINPIVFHYHGAVAAGQVGMTWHVLSSLQNVAAAWVKTRIPRFGMLIAQADYRELDRIFFRLSGLALMVMTLTGGSFVILCVALAAAWPSLAARLLPPGPTALLAVVMTLGLIPDFQWTYIHAHKRSPHLILSIASALTTGLLIWWLGMRLGAAGAILALLIVLLCFSLPVWSMLWWSFRLESHGNRLEDSRS